MTALSSAQRPDRRERLTIAVTVVHCGETGPSPTTTLEADMTSTDTPMLNGVNVEAILGARQALTDAPEAAKFQWRAKSEWVNGTHSKTTIDGFSGLGQEHNHVQPFTLD